MLEKRKTKESIIRKKVSFVPQDFLENSSRILREFFKNSCRLEKILGSSCEILEKNNSVRNLVENEQKSQRKVGEKNGEKSGIFCEFNSQAEEKKPRKRDEKKPKKGGE